MKVIIFGNFYTCMLGNSLFIIAYLHNMIQKKKKKLKINFILKKMKFKLFEITLRQKVVQDSKISKKLSYNQCQTQTKN